MRIRVCDYNYIVNYLNDMSHLIAPYRFKDYGVKGMKKGVVHEDPKTGGGGQGGHGGSAQAAPKKRSNKGAWKSRLKKLGKAAAIGGGILGATMLGQKIGNAHGQLGNKIANYAGLGLAGAAAGYAGAKAIKAHANYRKQKAARAAKKKMI